MTELRLIRKIVRRNNKADSVKEEFKSDAQKGTARQPKPEGTILSSDSITEEDFMEREFPNRPFILKPWMKCGTLSILYAKRGIGKTWFSLALAVAITRKQLIGRWEPVTPVGCIYLDGEMPRDEIQARLKKLTNGLPPAQAPLSIISKEEIICNRGRIPDLGDEKWRNDLLDDLKNNSQYRLLIIDNLSCLLAKKNENIKQHWDDVNQWLLRLRANGIAAIVVHHAGKNGDQRGSSGHEDNMDYSICLTKSQAFAMLRGPSMQIDFEKCRNLNEEESSSFSLRIVDTDKFHNRPWETTHNNNRMRGLLDMDDD